MDLRTKRFVVWDGAVERTYIDDARFHDCMVCADFKLLSVQSLRRHVLELGHEPILIFACEAGKAAYEYDFHNEPGGAFSHFFQRVLEAERAIPLRELIRDVNREIKAAGFDQKCEVICLPDRLEDPLLSTDERICDPNYLVDNQQIGQGRRSNGRERCGSPGGAKVVMMFDMCRTPSSGDRGSPDIGMFGEGLTARFDSW
jgi:hypothetical protein